MTQAEGAMAADFVLALPGHEAAERYDVGDEEEDATTWEIVQVGSAGGAARPAGQRGRGGARPLQQDASSDSGSEPGSGDGARAAAQPQEQGRLVVRPGPDPWPTARRKLRAAVRAIAVAPRFNLDPASRRSYELDRAVDAKAVAQIDLDVPRTAGSRVLLQACVGRIRSLLLRSLAEDPELGYCQGLNLVAAVFVVASGSQDEAYARLSRLLRGARGLWLPGLPLLDAGLGVFEACVQDRAWFHHLNDHGVESTMYLPQALMTTMAMWLPLEMLVKCIYVAEEDGLAGLLAMAIALLDLCGDRLLDTPCMEGLLQVFKGLKGFVPPVDAFLCEVKKVLNYTTMCLRVRQALDREPTQVPFARRGSQLLDRDGQEAFEPCMTASPRTPRVSEFSPDFGMSIPAIMGSVEDSAPDSSWFSQMVSPLLGLMGASDEPQGQAAEADEADGLALEELIKSVHSFSVHPIVVVHYGMTPAPHWTQEDYPRLVLLNAAPIPPHAERSFHFNKFRAMLMARALTGVELDSDQFVAPGVDALFDRTEEEVTRDYPLPILPAHFWPYGPEDKNLGGPALWSRYCPASDCKWQSARWGHAHPTWTFWALPFLGRWLRRNFRDETLPARRDSQMPPLRVTSVTEDEDLLNAGTWEEEGFKQWCKFDLPDPSEFRTLLDSPAAALKCQGHGCGDIQGDPRFNAGGVAKVFYTAHHAVDPDESKRFVQEILKRHRQGSLPPPILYRGRFFRDGRELKRAHPTLECLI